MRIVLLLILFFVNATVCLGARIVLVADAWPPYNNPIEDEQKGYIVDIAERIFAQQGHEIVYKIMPWKVAVEETRKGTFDGLIGADTEDGAGFVFPNEAAGGYHIAFFVKKGTPWRFTNTRSLERIKLGVAEGYGYSKWLDEYIQANKKDYNRIQSATGDYPLITNIRKLLADKIDATTACTDTLYYTAKKMGVADDLVFAGSGGQGRAVYLVFSPAKTASKIYAQVFDEGIRRLRSTGELKEILQRYGLKDWKE